MIKILPFIVASILAVVLSFFGPTQAAVGALILIVTAFNTYVLAGEYENPGADQINAILERERNNAQIQAGVRARQDSYIRELNQRLLALESRQTGNDPFGG